MRPDRGASYARARAAEVMDRRGHALVSAQLGRPARGASAPVHRCVFGLPTVVRVHPRLPDGTPFPTVFWMTCPVLRSAVGRLESDGTMHALNERLATDPELRAAHAAALARYRELRDELGGALPGDPYAGGDERHVKCLHVHVAHHLATGDNPVGQAAYEQIAPVPCPGPCVDDTDVEAWTGEVADHGGADERG